MLGFLIDTIIRVILVLLGVGCLSFIGVVIILSIGEKKGWWR